MSGLAVNLLYAAGLVAFVALVAYVASRAASIAHFRSKMEHFRRVRREIEEDE